MISNIFVFISTLFRELLSRFLSVSLSLSSISFDLFLSVKFPLFKGFASVILIYSIFFPDLMISYYCYFKFCFALLNLSSYFGGIFGTLES